ncbi:MAG: hypothetical protein CL581_01980 [Alteromonadaceae bacterium]|uniref:DUF2069 domain-containing protein n=1 Tax=unclassified Marinobacter TaxID=83889 RepID=UPI000C49B669|nr:DUF2069 domain-containing protein [Marinobacter sp. BGYM27]MAA63536.1 hypothetical protein [Alteromonadaceae bacterium]MBH86464.1 hypothetical protein [Alteromonadaceae bacterium]MDG5500643.1 DUF2069 domain-containing protein [Marinobacter sp. BGYM27]|tara:strand:- start:4 stop:360 length:357 start_codon:yes stop_codon:yes gene_type:complete
MLHSARARTTRLICQVLYLGLIAMLLATTFWPAPDPALSLPLILSIKLVPLLIFIPVILNGNNRGMIWLSFVLIFYFTQFVVNAWLSEGEIAATVSAIIALLLFVSAMFHLKLNRPAA